MKTMYVMNLLCFWAVYTLLVFVTYGVISAGDDDSLGSSLNGVGREEGEVLGFKGVLIGEVGATGLGFGLSSEGGVVYLEASGLDDTDVGRDTISKLNLQIGNAFTIKNNRADKNT